MAYNHGREDRKWRIWKEAEEKVLREHGVDEAVIEQIRMEDRADFTESGKRYSISFKDGQGEHHELEVSEQLFIEFRQMERRNRNLLQWNQRHREFNEVWDETLYRWALRVPKTLDERMIEKERNEMFFKAVARLPEI